MNDQVERLPRPRRRILNAALQLVSEDGYEGLQVRTLAQRANVSSRTIYMHFDSLDGLLLAAMGELSQPLYEHYRDTPPRGRTPRARVRKLITELTGTMTANRTLTVALLRALLSGKPDVVPYVIGFAQVLEELLASAIATGRKPTDEDRHVAEVLQCVWFTALIGYAIGSVSEAHVTEVMDRTARRLLSDGA